MLRISPWPPKPLLAACYRLLIAAGAVALWSGCGSKSAESYVPASDDARTSVERTLTAWQTGKTAGRIEPESSGGVALQAVDFDWNAGKKLTTYEILSELPREEGPRRFNVRLTLGGAAPIEVTYYVVGQDPVWVFRDRDYAQTMSM